MKKILCFAILCLGGILASVSQPAPPPPPLSPANTQGLVPPPPPGEPQTPPPPAPYAPSGWGTPGYLAYPPSGDWMNQGTINVMATGYDTESVLVQIPLVVSYSYNGATYNVTVLNAWSPFTQTWNMGVDIPASPTSYFFNGFTYNWMAPLPSGNFYFNL